MGSIHHLSATTTEPRTPSSSLGDGVVMEEVSPARPSGQAQPSAAQAVVQEHQNELSYAVHRLVKPESFKTHETIVFKVRWIPVHMTELAST
jgi:hypothetical protein